MESEGLRLSLLSLLRIEACGSALNDFSHSVRALGEAHLS